MKPQQFQEFMQNYSSHFDILKDIVFNCNVRKVARNSDDSKWMLEMEFGEKVEVLEFDKVAFCHGYQTAANIPTFDGQEKFEGTILHSQQYRR